MNAMAVGAIVLLLGCRADPTCSREPALDWDNFGHGFTATWCAGCHSSLLDGEDRRGAPVGVDLNDLVGVRQHADRYLARATGDAPTMPPSGGPSDAEVAMAEEWLLCSP